MKKLATKDGSETFYNDLYDDIYHSTTGAIEESLKKYVAPCGIAQLSAQGGLNILDIGFGLGYNFCAALDAALQANPACRINIISLEKHEDILAKVQEITPPVLKHYHLIKSLAARQYKSLPYGPVKQLQKDNLFLEIVMGSAEQILKKLAQSHGSRFDAVLHDAFAPQKNPELWTAEFFTDIRRLMKKNSVLATYSCARHVRDNLKQAGFTISDGPKVGRRGPSTVAKNLGSSTF